MPRFAWLAVFAAAWLALASGPISALGQDEPKSKPDSKGKSSGIDKGKDDDSAPDEEKAKTKAKGDDDDDDSEIDSKSASKDSAVQVFADSAAERAMRNTYQEIRGQDRFMEYKQLLDMARGAAPVDRALLEKFVATQAVVLTKKANIQALLTPNPKATGTVSPTREPVLMAIPKATHEMLELLRYSENNLAFRSTYAELLRANLTPVLSGHLFSRTQAMTVLQNAASPDMLETFTSVLSDPKQPYAMKLSASLAISKLVDRGRRPGVNPQQAVKAGQALADLLATEGLPWFCKIRALEAMGSLRNSTDPQEGAGKATIATPAARLLLDPKERVDVRAWACWALGVMRYSPTDEVNYTLVAKGIGRLTIDIGEKMLSADQKKAAVFEALIVEQLLPAFTGSPGVPDTGFNSARLGAAAGVFQDLQKRIRDLGLAGERLIREPKTKVKANQAEVKGVVDSLAEAVAKIEAKSDQFTSAGPKLEFESEGSTKPESAKTDAAKATASPSGE